MICFGIETTNTIENYDAADPKRMAELIRQAPQYAVECRPFLPILEEEGDVKGFVNKAESSAASGITTILANVIREAAGIDMTVFSYTGEAEESYLMYCQSFPWDMADSQKNVEQKDVVNAVRKYVRILTGHEPALDEFVTYDL